MGSDILVAISTSLSATLIATVCGLIAVAFGVLLIMWLL